MVTIRLQISGWTVFWIPAVIIHQPVNAEITIFTSQQKNIFLYTNALNTKHLNIVNRCFAYKIFVANRESNAVVKPCQVSEFGM